MKLCDRKPEYFKKWVWKKVLIGYPKGYHFLKIEIADLLWLAYRKGKKAGQNDINGRMP